MLIPTHTYVPRTDTHNWLGRLYCTNSPTDRNVRPEVGWDKDTTTCHSTNSLAMEQGTPTQAGTAHLLRLPRGGTVHCLGRTGRLGRLAAPKDTTHCGGRGESHKGIHEHTHACTHTHTHTHTHCNNPFTTLECNGLECCPISAPICRPFPLTPKDRWLPRTQCHCPSLPSACLLSDGSQTNNHPLTREATHLVEGGESRIKACMHADTQTDKHRHTYTTQYTTHTHTHTHTYTHKTHQQVCDSLCSDIYIPPLLLPAV